MTKLESLFRKRDRKEAISHEEFQSVGWDESEYIEYLNRCEILHAGFVFFSGTGEMEEYIKSYERYGENSPIKIIKTNNDDSKPKSKIELEYEKIYAPLPLEEAKSAIQPIYDAVEDFIEWINPLFEKKIMDIDYNIFFLGVFTAFNIRFPQASSNPSNPLSYIRLSHFDIYIDSDQFRHLIETFISRELLKGESLDFENVPFSDNEKINNLIKGRDIEEIPEEEIIDIISKLEDEVDFDYLDPILDDDSLKSYTSLRQWGNGYVEIQDIKDDYYTAIEELEEELKERPIRKYVPEEAPVVVVNDWFTCKKKNHNTQKIMAVFQTKDKDGRRSTRKEEAGYCPICNTFSISQSYCQYLATKGIFLLNPLINETDYNDTNNTGARNFSPEENTLYIYAGDVRCVKDHSKLIESVTAIIDDIYGNPIKINVNYCPVCAYYFLKQSEYQRYLQRYKYLPIRMQYMGANKDTDFYFREEYSFLSLAGYTVRKDIGLSDDIRHRILVGLINSGYSKFELEKHLDMLINTNGSRSNMENARNKWLSDLKYVRNLKLDKQRKVKMARIVVGSPKYH